MPSLSEHQSASVTKALIAADSGLGKTGSLISLVEADYKLRILDFDNGLDYLANLVKQRCPDKMANVEFAICTDKFKSVNGQMIPDGQPKAFSKGMSMLTHWKEGDTDLGKITEWGPEEVLVIDSMTLMSRAALRHILALNGRLAATPQIQDWGQAMERIESCLELLYSDAIGCNVVITSHVTAVQDTEGGAVKEYPAALGQKLPPKIGRYFNSVLTIKRKGAGGAEKRVIKTTSEGLLECKASAPGLPSELPIDTGLADYFKAVQGVDSKTQEPSAKS